METDWEPGLSHCATCTGDAPAVEGEMRCDDEIQLADSFAGVVLDPWTQVGRKVEDRATGSITEGSYVTSSTLILVLGRTNLNLAYHPGTGLVSLWTLVADSMCSCAFKPKNQLSGVRYSRHRYPHI